ncbi:MAG: flagellar basal body P-ring formation chaperone FlgA [Desulfobacterales bacterium]|jgi:flagella basal body P-ring formation protein FlgA
MKRNNPKTQKSKHFYPTLFCMLAVALILGATPELLATPLTTIRVRDRVEIDGDEILLGQIAEIKGSDFQMIRHIENIVIGKAPLPGKSRQYDENYLKMRLKQYHIDLANIILEAPERIEVLRSCIKIEKQKIEEIISNFLIQSISQENKNIRIKEIRVPEEVLLSKGQISYKVTVADNQPLRGKCSIAVEFRVNGYDQKKIWAIATIEILGPVVVTRKPLGRYKPIVEDDIELKTMDLSDLPDDVITDAEAVLGKRTRRAIGAQVPLRADTVELPPLVKRGDLVVIIAESRGLKITTRGQVKKKGRLGEQIPVVNLDSKKVLYARVIDANTVKVDF